MFEKYLEKLIKQKLGAFLDGMDQNQINFGMTQANLSLNNVKLRQDAFLKLSMPIKIELGEIKHLDVRIPWLNIGSKPVEITIDGLNIIVSLQKKQDWQVIDLFEQSYLEQTLLSYIAQIESELAPDDQQGYFTKLAMKVLDNISVKIRDIHVRFEDHFSSIDQSYSFGIVLKRLEVQTTNQSWVAQFVDRTLSNQNLFKLVVIEGLGLYLNPNEKLIIHQQTSNMEKRLSILQVLITDDKRSPLQYLLKPMNLNLQIEHQTKGLKKLNVNVSLDTLHLSFLRSQLHCLSKFLEVVAEFRKVQNQLFKTKKYKFLRPVATKVTRENAKEFWQYAYQSIKRSNKAKNGSMKEFLIPKKDILLYEKIFTQVYANSIVKKDGVHQIKLAPSEKDFFIHILTCVDPSHIKAWIKSCIQPTITKQKTESKGFTSWLLGSSKKEQIMSETEKEALEKELSSIPDAKPGNLTLSIQLSIKEIVFDIGTTNHQNITEGIRIYTVGTSIQFVQFPTQEHAFEMKGAINDFGVDLYDLNQISGEYIIQDSVIVSNKKIFPSCTEDQWSISVVKRPDLNKDIEYDIELQANPLLLTYHKEFVKRAMLISQIGANEETQNAAIDKIEDFKEATSNQIYTIIYKKANKFRINIASPIIVLPLSANSDPDSPIWVLRLGDLKVVSREGAMTTSVVEYERFEIYIDQIRMQYFRSYSHWRSNLDQLSNFRDRTLLIDKNDLVFTVLEDCWMKFGIGIKQKKAGLLIMANDQLAEHQLKPKLMLKGKSSEININLTHSIYNKLVNLGQIFDISKDEELQKPIHEDHIDSKQFVLQNAKKIGQLQKRLDPLNQWETYFCILSGGYLYFYKDSQQLMPSTYFYLKGVEISQNSDEISLPHNILLSNRFGECCIAMINESTNRDWAAKINERIYEIKQEDEEEHLALSHHDSNLSSSIKNIKKKRAVNHQAVSTLFEFEVPLFQTVIYDELKTYQEWIHFSMTHMKVANVKRKTDSKMDFRVRDINLVDTTMKINKKLISKKLSTPGGDNENDAMTIIIANISKKNPMYNQVDSHMNIIMEQLNIYMQPVSINELLKFTRNSKPGCSYNMMQSQITSLGKNNSHLIQEESMQDVINSHHFESENVSQSVAANNRQSEISRQQYEQFNKVSCKTIKETNSSINLVMNNVSICLLHQEHNMELYRLDSERVEIDYVIKYDHFSFGVKFKNAIFYDLTNYPYTIDPKLFAEKPDQYTQKLQEFASMNPQNEEDYGFIMMFESYNAPTCVLKKKGYSSKIEMRIKPMVINFFNEAFMRFFNYLFEQFMNSLLYADPYSDPQKEEFENIKRRNTMRKDTLIKITDFKQQTEIFEMDIKINEFALNIPDRPGSKTYLSLTVNEFAVSQHLHLKAGRMNLNKEKELYIKSFRMNMDNSKFEFGGEIALTEQPFNLLIIFENLSYSPLLSKVDPKVIEQANHLRIRFDPIQLTLRQDIYTSILRILDLNINYTDFLTREYYFFKYLEMEEYFKTIENIVGMRIKIDFKCFAIRLEHIDHSFLSEIMLVNTVIKITKYRDYKNEMDVKIQNLFIFDRIQPIRITSTVEITELLKFVQSEDCVIQPKSVTQYSVKRPKEDLLKNKKNIKKAEESQVSVSMVIKPNGEKLMNVEIQGLKITIKPHVLMMVYYFMLNSFPEYDQLAVDKPSYINFDPENAPHTEMSVDTKDCLLVFQNRPCLKTLVCKGRIIFDMLSQNIKEVKKALNSGILDKYMDDNIKNELLSRNLEDGFNSADENEKDEDDYASPHKENGLKKTVSSMASKVITDIAYSMRIKIEDFCPFVCSLNQLNENKGFEKIKKRQLMNPFSMSYLTSYRLHRYQKHGKKSAADLFDYGVKVLQDLTLNKIKAKISLQDLHLMFQIVTYANQNVTHEYIKKLEKVDQYIKEQREERLNQQATDSPVEKFDRRKTIKQDFGIIIENDEEQSDHDADEAEGFYPGQQENNFAEILNHQFEQTIASQVQRFRSTTKAFSKIAHKYTIVALKSSNVSKKSSNQKEKQYASSFNKLEEESKSKSLTPTNQKNSSLGQNKFGSNRFTHVQQKKNPSNIGCLTPKKSKIGQFNENSPDQDSHEDNDEDDEFHDARSEIFFSVKETENQKSIGTHHDAKLDVSLPLTSGQSKNIIDQKSSGIDNKSTFLEKVEYHSALDNVISQEWTYSIAGLSILFINDYDNVFCPVIDIDIPDLQMHADSENNTSSTHLTVSRLKIFCFNALIGDWEPFLENFQMEYDLIESESVMQSKQSFIDVKFLRPININITESCMHNLIDTYYSWMETPPYQIDDYKNSSMNQNNRNSINPPDIEKKLKSSNTGSINDDPNIIEDDESDSGMSSSQNLTELQNKLLNNENFNKVSPYSIKNLTSYPFRIESNSKSNNLEYQEVPDPKDSLVGDQRDFFEPLRLSLCINDSLEVLPNKTIDYSVDLDKESNNLLIINNKKQRQSNNMSFRNRASTVNTLVQNAVGGDSKKRVKNEELVTLMFDNYEEIKSIDLNKIAQANIELYPKAGQDLFISIMNQNDGIRQGSSVAPPSISEEESQKRQSRARKRKSRIVPREFEKLRYGVVLNKMRKIMTIRQEYIIDNQTLQDYVIRIAHYLDKNYYKEYLLKSNSQFGLNSSYYRNYTLQFKVSNEKETKQTEEEQKGNENENFNKKPIMISDIIATVVDTGRAVNHDGNQYTYLKKVLGSIKDTFDLILQPPVTIKNCLPCTFEVLPQQINLLAQGDAHIVGDVEFEKEDEKHFHLIEYKGANMDEIVLRFKVSGFVWTIVNIKKKSNADFEDKEVEIKDAYGNTSSICVRVQYTKAWLQLIFYAYTVILNQSSYQLHFYYNTLNKQQLAGQDLRQEYCLAKKDESLLASLSNRFSKGLQIKNPGLTENFSIQVQTHNVSHDEETIAKSQRGAQKSTLISSERKYEFVYQTYMSLVSEDESLYTKIVCVAPKYVMINKMKRAICIAQAGNEYVYEVVESGDRKEWVWQDQSLDSFIQVKKEDEDLDRDWGNPSLADRIKQNKNATRWLWTDPISVKEMGIMTIANKKEENRFNQPKSIDIIKIIKKQIDGTNYVIFQEEDEDFPLHRLENMTNSITVWYSQKGQRFEDEACQLQPLTTAPYAFIDPKHTNQELEVFFTTNEKQTLKKNLGEKYSYEFENLGERSSIDFECPQTGTKIKLYVTIKTDGCSKIIRFSDRSVEQEEKLLKKLRSKSLKHRQSSEINQESENQIVKVTKTVKLEINEILISFVNKITKREKNVVKNIRKEIAILTIQNILFEKFSSTEQNVDNNKIQIQSIQIDNQSSFNPLFPTIFQPRLFKHNESTPMIEVECNFKTDNQEITYIDLLDFKFSGLVIKFDDRFLGYGISFANELMSSLKTSLTGIHPIFNNPSQIHVEKDQAAVNEVFQNHNHAGDGGLLLELQRKDTGQFGRSKGVIQVLSKHATKDLNAQFEQNLKSNRSSVSSKQSKVHNKDDQQSGAILEMYKNWRIKKIDENNKRIFIMDCKLSALEIEISFLARRSMTHLEGKTAQSQTNSSLNSWGLTLINIDQAPIRVKHFHQKQIFGFQEDITSLISSHYQEALKKNVLKLIGSTELLGNPIKFLNTIGNGFRDFKNMPMERTGQGASGFAKGAFWGTVSLMKNTIEGTFGFAQSITGQFAKLLLVVAIDEDYLGTREEKLLTEKPRDIVEGVGFGCQTAVDSLQSGVLGVFARPYLGASREGVWGFTKGLYSGAAGLVLKPLSGGLDLISKSTEGIKNTVKIFEAQLIKDRRRLPRTFYGFDEQIKTYNDMDPYIIIRILETLEGPFKKDHYIETIKFKDSDRTRFLVLSEEHLILVDAAQKSLKWHIDSTKIQHIEKFQNGLMIHLSQKYDGRIQVPIEINNPTILSRVYEKLQQLEREGQ